MKTTRLIILFSIASFIFGGFVSSICHNWLSHAQELNGSHSAASIPNPSPTPCPEQIQNTQNEFSLLTNDKYITKFNGTKLKLEYGSWAQPVDIPSFINDAKIIPLKTGGVLVHLEDALYKLDERHQIVWKHKEGQPIFDYALVESTGLIYGTAGDNVMFILNANTGKELHRESRNGSAAYGVVDNYGNDMCLVTDNFAMYREKGRGANIDPMKDGITCWRGTEVVWHQDFPPDSQLVVNSNRILAVTKTKTGIYINEISVPQPK